MNFYAVKKGRVPGIYKTWDECKAQVMGYSGAIYKKFKTEEEASVFIYGDILIKDKENSIIVGEKNNDEVLKCSDNEIISYVDGSFRLRDKTFSYGAVLFNDDIYETASERFYNEDITMRNVSGEIRGAMYAMKRAIELNKDVLYLHYDYAGIEHWARGQWKTNKEGTIAYKNYYDSIKDKLEVHFIKVKAHSGVEYNEIVDKLAKEAK